MLFVQDFVTPKKRRKKKKTRHAPFAKGRVKLGGMDEVTAFLVKKTFWPLWSQIEIWANKFWRGVKPDAYAWVTLIKYVT